MVEFVAGLFSQCSFFFHDLRCFLYIMTGMWLALINIDCCGYGSTTMAWGTLISTTTQRCRCCEGIANGTAQGEKWHCNRRTLYAIDGGSTRQSFRRIRTFDQTTLFSTTDSYTDHELQAMNMLSRMIHTKGIIVRLLTICDAVGRYHDDLKGLKHQ